MQCNADKTQKHISLSVLFFTQQNYSHKSLFEKDFTQKLMFLFLTLMDDDFTLNVYAPRPFMSVYTLQLKGIWKQKKKKLSTARNFFWYNIVLKRFAGALLKSAVIWRMTSSPNEQMRVIDFSLSFFQLPLLKKKKKIIKTCEHFSIFQTNKFPVMLYDTDEILYQK